MNVFQNRQKITLLEDEKGLESKKMKRKRRRKKLQRGEENYSGHKRGRKGKFLAKNRKNN